MGIGYCLVKKAPGFERFIKITFTDAIDKMLFAGIVLPDKTDFHLSRNNFIIIII
jgi:hypothetical protein